MGEAVFEGSQAVTIKNEGLGRKEPKGLGSQSLMRVYVDFPCEGVH